eukprot:6961823-Prymnesium_polylepis.2
MLAWGEVTPTDADEVLTEALASVRRHPSEFPLTSELGRRISTAYAGCLAQRGLFTEAAVLLCEVLEAFVRQDGGYTAASWGGDGGLGLQIQALAKYTRTAGPDEGPEACTAMIGLLRVHTTALRNYTGDGEHNLRDLYYEDDAHLMLEHYRGAASVALLMEAESLARELATQRRFKFNLLPLAKLLEVLEAQVALGKEGAQSAVEECRALILTELIDQLEQPAPHLGERDLFGTTLDLVTKVGFYHDGSGGEQPWFSLCGIELRFLRQRGMLGQAEAMQRASVDRQSLGHN